MNLKELNELTSKMLAEGVDPLLQVGVKGHYGELETELEGLDVQDSHWKRVAATKQFIVLEGIPSYQPEPD